MNALQGPLESSQLIHGAHWSAPAEGKTLACWVDEVLLTSLDAAILRMSRTPFPLRIRHS